jgi:hypothetical protein
MSLPNGADRPPLQVCVVRESGGWTPGAHVVVESGNHLELNERELEWLIGEPPDLTGRAGSSVAGQGAPDRPEPAQPSTAEEQ